MAMTRFVVATHFVWNEYPGLRAGRAYAGLPDVSRRPSGETHFVDGQDAALTVCGLPRASFPYEFPELADGGPTEACAACRTGTAQR
jgi:hypothetical protein